MISASTRNLGVVATMSTLAYPPFMLARLASTVDSIAGGRFGWNIVTSAENAAAQNFGLDALPPRELRYDMAEEYMDLCYKLWNSWEPDAVIRDRATSTYADYKKVHTLNFEGKFFKCRGPLNTVRSPQGVPALVQAGGSPKGRNFAAKHANSIVAVAPGIEKMKEFRDDVRARREGAWTQSRRYQDPLSRCAGPRRNGGGSVGQEQAQVVGPDVPRAMPGAHLRNHRYRFQEV